MFICILQFFFLGNSTQLVSMSTGTFHTDPYNTVVLTAITCKRKRLIANILQRKHDAVVQYKNHTCKVLFCRQTGR